MDSLFVSFFLLLKFTSTKPIEEITYCNDCDILLGGLVPVHPKHENESKFGQCDFDRFNHFAIPRIEALLFAVDQVNNDPDLLRGHTLGINIQDTCGIETVATEKAKNFLRNKCKSTKIGFIQKPYFAGVIGGMYSSVSIAVATFLQPWYIPQVSPAATSVKLSDKDRFKIFARTVPSDTYQNQVILDILKRLNWTLISTIVSDGSFSEKGNQVFNQLAEKKGICNSMSERVPNHPSDKDFKEIICRILSRTDANAIILFTNVEDTRRILKTMKLLTENANGKYRQ